MKEIVIHEPVVTNIPLDSAHRFTIKNSQKMYNILSDTLYSNKPLAIIRELSCNALDAHCQAGNKEPFNIYLPNSLSEMFVIHDFGVGLSDEQIYKIFTVYGESTKTDSNDFVGSLGLGSKSPFSYCGSFNVISRYNGKKYFYTAFKDESNFPSLIRGAVEDTHEGNGLEISFPVARKDFNTFEQMAREVLRNFDPTTYQVFGTVKKFAIKKEEVVIQGEDWEFHNSRYETFNVVQGNVRYSVEIASIKNRTHVHETIFTMPITVIVPIGTLDYQPSRERLSYDDQTIQRLKEIMDRVYLELKAKVEEHVASCKTYWEACVLVNQMTTTMFGTSWTYIVSKIFSSNGSLKWNGIELTKSIPIPVDPLEALGVKVYWKYKYSMMKIFPIMINENKVLRRKEYLPLIFPTGKETYGKNYGPTAINMFVKEGVSVYVMQKQSGVVKQLANFARSKVPGNLYFVVDKQHNVKEVMKYLDKYLSGCPVEDVSSKFAPVPKVKTVAKCFMLKTNAPARPLNKNSWLEVDLNEDDFANNVVVEMERWTIVPDQGLDESIGSKMGQLLTFARRYLLSDANIKVIGMRKAVFNKMKSEGKLNKSVTFREKVKGLLARVYKENQKKLDEKILYCTIGDLISSKAKILEVIRAGHLPKTHWTIPVANEIEKVMSRTDDSKGDYYVRTEVSEIVELFKEYKVTYNDRSSDSLIEKINLIGDRYQMFSLIDSYRLRHNAEKDLHIIANYVTMIDNYYESKGD